MDVLEVIMHIHRRGGASMPKGTLSAVTMREDSNGALLTYSHEFEDVLSLIDTVLEGMGLVRDTGKWHDGKHGLLARNDAPKKIGEGCNDDGLRHLNDDVDWGEILNTVAISEDMEGNVDESGTESHSKMDNAAKHALAREISGMDKAALKKLAKTNKRKFGSTCAVMKKDLRRALCGANTDDEMSSSAESDGSNTTLEGSADEGATKDDEATVWRVEVVVAARADTPQKDRPRVGETKAPKKQRRALEATILRIYLHSPVVSVSGTGGGDDRREAPQDDQIIGTLDVDIDERVGDWSRLMQKMYVDKNCCIARNGKMYYFKTRKARQAQPVTSTRSLNENLIHNAKVQKDDKGVGYKEVHLAIASGQNQPSRGDDADDEDEGDTTEYSQSHEDGKLQSPVARMGNRAAAKQRSSQRQDVKEWVLARNRVDLSMNDRHIDLYVSFLMNLPPGDRAAAMNNTPTPAQEPVWDSTANVSLCGPAPANGANPLQANGDPARYVSSSTASGTNNLGEALVTAAGLLATRGAGGGGAGGALPLSSLQRAGFELVIEHLYHAMDNEDEDAKFEELVKLYDTDDKCRELLDAWVQSCCGNRFCPVGETNQPDWKLFKAKWMANSFRLPVDARLDAD